MAEQVDQLLLEANAFDALAGHVIHVIRQRHWPVLTADLGPDLRAAVMGATWMDN